MANIGYATLSVIPSAAGFSSALARDITPGLSGVGRSAGKVLGAGLLIGAAAVVAGIGAIIKTGVGEAMDASAGTAQLAAGIKSTNNAAGVTVGGLNALASSIQGYSGQTDDSIVQSEALLLTFTNIKNGVGEGSDIFDRATVATANMAARMGGDAAGAAIQLGKALNDPVAGMAGLGRAGVQFSDAQKETIRTLVESGDVMGAQKVILAELETQFGGAAAAAGESLPGKLAIAKRSFEDVSQSVVEGLLPLVLPGLTSIGETITTKVIPAITDFIQGFKDGTGAGGTFRDVLTKVGTVLGAVAGFIKQNADWLLPLAGIILGVVVAIQVWTGVQAALNVVMALNPIGLIVIAIAALVAGLVWAWNNVAWFRDGLTAAWEWIKGVTSTAWEWIKANLQTIIEAIIVVITGPIGLLAVLIFENWDKIKAATVTAWTAISDFFSGLWTSITSTLTSAWDGIVGFFSAIPGRVGAFFTMVKDKIVEIFSYSPLGMIIENWDGIMAFLGGLPASVGGAISGLWDGLWTSFKGALNSIISAWNNFKITMGGGTTPWGASWPSFTIDTPNIPLLASGALVTNPALAMLGESGPEAVLPYSRVDEFAGMVARQLAAMDLGKPDGRQGAGNLIDYDRLAAAMSRVNLTMDGRRVSQSADAWIGASIR